MEEARGRYLSIMGFMCAAVSAGDLFLKEHASSSARTVCFSIKLTLNKKRNTSHTIDSPLLELLKCDVCCGRCDIEIEPVFVFQGLVAGVCELLLSMCSQCCPLLHIRPLGINP